jgi:acyl-CoA thioesterase I
MVVALACGGQARLLVQDADPAGMLPRDRAAVVTYVALGDSTVQGVGASSPATTYVAQLFSQLQRAYPNAVVHNLGVSGAIAPDVLENQVPRAREIGPRLVTLSVGPNDLTRGRTPEQYGQDIDQIFAALRADPQTLIVVNLLPDLAVAPVFTPEQRPLVAARTVEFNQVLQQKAEAYGAVIVDLYTASQQEVPVSGEYVSGDGYHPSDAGYARWAEIMWRSIEPRIPPVG